MATVASHSEQNKRHPAFSGEMIANSIEALATQHNQTAAVIASANNHTVQIIEMVYSRAA